MPSEKVTGTIKRTLVLACKDWKLCCHNSDDEKAVGNRTGNGWQNLVEATDEFVLALHGILQLVALRLQPLVALLVNGPKVLPVLSSAKRRTALAAVWIED